MLDGSVTRQGHVQAFVANATAQPETNFLKQSSTQKCLNASYVLDDRVFVSSDDLGNGLIANFLVTQIDQPLQVQNADNIK